MCLEVFICFHSQVKLIRVDMKSSEFRATFSQSHAVFAKYQMAIHKDTPDECGEMQVGNFFPQMFPVCRPHNNKLIVTPLILHTISVTMVTKT